MLDVLVIILLVLVGLVILVIGVALSRPKAFRYERSMTTAASASEIYSVVSDLRRWAEWSPWHKRDPAMTTENTGGPGEVGATHSWDGNKQVGAGRMTITAVEPDRSIELKLDFIRPFPATNKVIWRIEDEGKERRVVWIMEGANEKLIVRVMVLFMNMEKMIGKDFDDGLASLKELVERP